MTEYVTVTSDAPEARTGAIKLHGPAAFVGMHKAGKLAAETLDMLVPHMVPGVTTAELDRLIYDFVLAGGGAYLVLQRGMVRIIIGMTFISHAANLIILSAGVGAWRQEPLMARAEPETAADALPQAFVLTAIVITMAVTAFMLAMAALGRDDEPTAQPSASTSRRACGWKVVSACARSVRHVEVSAR